MFGRDPFYFGLIRKYVSLFGTIFSDISIVRSIDGTTADQIIRVPISYASKDKMLARITADPQLDRQFAVQLPTMSFEQPSMTYDPTRKLNTLGKQVKKSIVNNKNKLAYQYNPVPYNFTFSLHIYVKNTEDGTKIIEQILPFFTPDWTPTVTLIPQLEYTADVPIVLTGISTDDQSTGDFLSRKILIYTLDFVMKGYLFGPITENPVIKFANTTFYIPTVDDLHDAIGNTTPSDRVTVQPGLTANGTPTSNISLTVPYAEIEANSDFGYVVNVYGIIEGGDDS